MLQYLMILVQSHKERMDERGASAVEYGLLVAGIAAVVVAAVFLLGGTVLDAFNTTNDGIGGTTTP